MKDPSGHVYPVVRFGRTPWLSPEDSKKIEDFLAETATDTPAALKAKRQEEYKNKQIKTAN